MGFLSVFLNVIPYATITYYGHNFYGTSTRDISISLCTTLFFIPNILILLSGFLELKSYTEERYILKKTIIELVILAKIRSKEVIV
ncbi:MAG: hypothetical protein KGD63_13670 [Candidatus Lokiarchaeota archaeon]|nr:hypothetical protein [Candidatus Lokiarchaeota archaeon]